MAHFLIYIPRDEDFTQITERDLGRVGLSDLVGNCSTLGTAKGPDGKQGMMYGWATRAKPYPDLRCAEDEQDWHECKGFWLGFWKSSYPNPSDLVRPYAYPGINVTLGDGNAWHIPKIKELTHDAILADDGSWKFVVQQQYHSIYLDSLEWHSIVRENKEFEFSDCVDYLVRCLSLNYRLTPEVVSHLRLINTSILLEALGATLGISLEAKE